MSLRWLVTGAGGRLGRDLVGLLSAYGAVTACSRAELDLTDADAVADAVAGHDLVVNAAAWTDVDGAEADEAAATAVNGHAVAGLARACARTGARLLHVSTDYVFDGRARTPYPEDAPTNPVNAYGRSKLVGEHAVRALLPHAGYVVRTAWLYGAGGGFVPFLLRQTAEGRPVPVVADQYGQPTWTVALARQLAELGQAAAAGTAAPGIYHGTAAGRTTWYELARAVLEATGRDPGLARPVPAAALARPARRPAFTVLGHGRWAAAGLAPPPHWRDQLAEALPQLVGGADVTPQAPTPPSAPEPATPAGPAVPASQ